MSYLSRFLNWLDRAAARAERERREAFLAQATDVYDLEQRMRRLERGSAFSHGWE
jgi:hypothetical protein